MGDTTNPGTDSQSQAGTWTAQGDASTAKPIDGAEMLVIAHRMLINKEKVCNGVGEPLTPNAIQHETPKALEVTKLIVNALQNMGVSPDTIFRNLASPSANNDIQSAVQPEIVPIIKENCRHSNQQGERDRS